MAHGAAPLALLAPALAPVPAQRFQRWNSRGCCGALSEDSVEVMVAKRYTMLDLTEYLTLVKRQFSASCQVSGSHEVVVSHSSGSHWAVIPICQPFVSSLLANFQPVICQLSCNHQAVVTHLSPICHPFVTHSSAICQSVISSQPFVSHLSANQNYATCNLVLLFNDFLS